MTRKLKCIMLVDDNPDDNFFHERVLRKNDFADVIIAKQSGRDALEHLQARGDHEHAHPDIIFLDINMPGMNGWEFLKEYSRLPPENQSRIVTIMLTTSDNPDDKAKANSFPVVSDFKTKPLTREMMDEILDTYFSS